MQLTRRSFIETAAGTAAALAVPGCATAALDVGAPVACALPVVIKTLILNG